MPRHLAAFFGRAVLAKADAGLLVCRRAGPVGRMSFADVDGNELGAIAVALGKFLEGAKLGPVGASGEAAEDEHDRFLAARVRQANLPLAVLRLEREVRGVVTDGRALVGRAELAV